MHDESTSVDQSPGFNRRSALKKAAVAGAVVWTAPVLLSESAQAVQFLDGGCTAKCGPSATVSVTGSATTRGCVTGTPGQEGVTALINAGTSAGGGSCGCDATAVVVVTSPAAGDPFEVRPKPNNANQGEFDVTATISCEDRDGNTITKTCSAVATAEVKPGSCQGVGVVTFTWTADLACRDEVCVPAEAP